ncbi:MAG: RNA methyltransferase [Myxococcales bacterium]|nr:RNA methyltransferase [Myxococcales bacterium]
MRVECPHAPRCSGCPLIGLEYAEQLTEKAQIVARAFAVYPALDGLTPQAPIGAEPTLGYRVRAKLVVGARGVIGLYTEQAHAVLDLPECRVLSAPVARVVGVLRALASKPPSAAGPVLTPAADGGALVAIDVREAQVQGKTQVLVSLVQSGPARASELQFQAAARAITELAPEVVGVAVSERAHKARVLGGAPRVLFGPAEVPDQIGQITHRAAHGAFVQAHRGQAARLHQAIEGALTGVLGTLAGRSVLELYAGSGAIALSLKARGAEVVLVESFAAAAASARRLGLTVISADAATFDPTRAFDAVVVNPPRRGLAPRVRATVAKAEPEVVVYVSCAPDTLARDLSAFSLHGYAPTHVQPFDMIPLSEQVETLVLLERAPVPLPTVLFENEELIVVDKAAHEPTTPQGEHASSLLARVRRLPGGEHAVPLHRLDLETSGVVVFARSSELVARWQPAFTGSTTQKRYLALVRGVTREKGAVNRPLAEGGRERPAHTRYRRLTVAGGHSLVLVEPREGKKHQIRRHMAGLGHAVVGDHRHGHGPTNRHFEEKHGLDRHLLHLERLELGTPAGDQVLVISSPLPPDFISVLQRLGIKPGVSS